MGWQLTTLGEAYDVRDGTHDSPKYQEIGCPLITSKNLKPAGLNFDKVKYISDNDFKKINERSGVHKGDVLFAMIGTIGNPIIVEVEPNFAIKNVALFKVPKNHNGKFLKYYLESKYVIEKMTKEAKGTTQKFVGLGYLRSFPIPLPPLPEQKRIVALLDTVFADLAQTRTKTEKNLKNARELFDSYLQQVFSQKGEGWVDGKMTDICEINTKLIDPKEDQYLDLLHIGAGNIISNTGELIKLQTAKEEGLISGKFVFDNSMILYSKIRPYLMKVCRPEFTGLCSADIYPLSPIKEKMNKDFLFYLLLSKDFTDYAISGSGRAGMPKVNRTHLFNYSVSIPNIEKQREYVIKMNEISSQSQELERIYQSKLTAIDELKKSILQKAFSGELTT